MRLEVSIKGLQEEGFFCGNGYYWFFSGVVWLGVAKSRTSLIAVWTGLMKRVKRDCQAWTRPKFARIERSRNFLLWEGYCRVNRISRWFKNSNGILYSQEHPLLNQQGSLCSLPPSELTGDLYVPFHLCRTFFSSLCFNLFSLFLFFFGLWIWLAWIMES